MKNFLNIPLIKVLWLITLLVAFFIIPLGAAQVDAAPSTEDSAMLRGPESQLEIVAQAKVGDVTQLKLLDMGTGEVKGLALDKKFQPLSETRAELAVLREEAEEFTGKLEPELVELVSKLRSERELSSVEESISESTLPVIIWVQTDEAVPEIARTRRTGKEGEEEVSIAAFKDFNLGATESLKQFIEESSLGQVAYQSPYAPVLAMDVPPSLLPELEQREDVQAIFLARTYNSESNVSPQPTYKPELNVSASTIGADKVWARGITGSGVKVAVVQRDGIYFGHNYLKDGTYCHPNSPNIGRHVTGMAGIIASTHPTYKGVAYGVPALLSGNSGSYNDADIIACTDWAISNGARLINMSFGVNSSSSLVGLDRYVDYIVRNRAVTVVKSVGVKDSQCFAPSYYVTSPGKGWNVITVGSYDDKGTPDNSDDEMAWFSCDGDPSSLHGDREKPEVAAPGVNIMTTYCTGPSNCFSTISGTAVVAAHVSGCAALLMERNPALKSWPESIKAVLMASAINNLEGSSRLSERDGAGGIRCDEADDVVRGTAGMESHGRYVKSDFPRTYTFSANAGQTVRVVTAWDSTTGAGSPPATDVLNADLDLSVSRPGGGIVGSSTSWDNSYEIAEFTAPSTGNYTATVSAYRFDGDSEYLGFATWNGTEPITTVLLTRHAEPDYDHPCVPNEPDNPCLSTEGEARAEKLVHVARKAQVSAIYSTNTNRTRETAEPLATALGLTINNYSDVNVLARKVLQEHIGQSVFVVGHSPTVPEIVDALGGDRDKCKIGNEFDNLCIVTVYQTGKVATLNLQYGEPTGLPDLVINNFETTGPVICDSMQEKAYVPIRFIVSNLGEAQSENFNVEIEQSWDGETFASVCFRDPNHSDPDPSAPDWCYPSTDTALTPGSTVTFAGEVTAYYIVHGPFFLRAKADSGYCGLEPHDDCSIQESNEDNNESILISLSCP